MPSRRPRPPKYRHYKPEDLAVVRIDGRDHYLGRYDSPESYERYDRLVAEWLVTRQSTPHSGGSARRPSPSAPITINELILAFWQHAKERYVKNGRPASIGHLNFRGHPFELNEREAEQSAHQMRHLSSPRPSDGEIDELKPPTISPISDFDSGDADGIEGLEFRDPIPIIDHHHTLSLTLEDDRRPLPGQVSKLLADTLGSAFRACSLGDFGVGGGGSRQDEDGRFIETDACFHLGINRRDPDLALHLIRETLWWVGAPAETDL